MAAGVPHGPEHGEGSWGCVSASPVQGVGLGSGLGSGLGLASGACACGKHRSKVGFSWQVCDAKHSHEEKGKDWEEDPVFSFPIHEHRLLYPSLRLGLRCLGSLWESALHPLWKCQALNPALVLAWAWAVFVQSLPRQLLFPRRCWGCCKTLCKALLREEDLPQALPCPWDSLPRCPRSPEFAQGSQEDEI